MDWVTLTKQQVECDALPPVCMACGRAAMCRVNRSFSHTPDWVGLLYLAGIFPGLIAEHFLTKEMRVSCPFCSKHRNHWRLLYWVAGVGWLVGTSAFAGIGCLVGLAVDSTSSNALFIGLGVGAGVGLLCWLAVLISLHSTRIEATRVTATEVTLQGVHETFAKAVREHQRQAVTIEPSAAPGPAA